MNELYEEINVWERTTSSTAIRYTCLRDVSTGKFAVQSADFFHGVNGAERHTYFQRQFLELLLETSPKERCEWFESLADAIKAHKAYFNE